MQLRLSMDINIMMISLSKLFKIENKYDVKPFNYQIPIANSFSNFQYKFREINTIIYLSNPDQRSYNFGTTILESSNRCYVSNTDSLSA